jgi:hypothetical protein
MTIRNYANIGTDNATWLATELDAPNGNRIAENLGAGHVTISALGLSILRELTEDEDGYIGEDETGIYLYIEGSAYLVHVDTEITTVEAATLANVSRSRFRAFAATHPTLTPSSQPIIRGRATSYYWTSEVLSALASRPGQGYRADLA